MGAKSPSQAPLGRNALSWFDFTFAYDYQRVCAKVSAHAKKILHGLTLGGYRCAHFQPEHFRVELPGALQIAYPNAEARNSNRLNVVRDGKSRSCHLRLCQ